MDEPIPARTLGDLKGSQVATHGSNRDCVRCSSRLSTYNPNDYCGACFASGKVELKK